MTAPDTAVPATALEPLLRRLDALESKEAIEQVMVAYMAAADRESDKGGHIARLFTADGRWESVGPHGNPGWAAVGRRELRRKFDRNVERMPFAAHFLTNGSVTLDGDTATGTWMYFQACTYRGEQALWIAGRYHNDFRRVDGQWLLSHLRVHNFFTTPYDQGWVRVEHMETP
ncbi:nuclear transport factor 2 family protein [Streptomyces shenzhenensis]|uniref:nuclear transport factor 2 family protein n=1 Tax=Streptomyces shenzhenensis TaxID=943815 RepID=UPI0036CDBD34